MPRKSGLSLVAVAALLFAATPAFAAASGGDEPPTAPDPVYQPMTQEPKLAPQPKETVSLGSDADIKGPAAGPEPYSAPSPAD